MKFLFMGLILVASIKSYSGNWDGTYRTRCASRQDNYIFSEVEIINKQFVTTFLAAEDEACGQVYLKYSIYYQFELRGYSWDGEVQKATYTPTTDEVAEALSEIGFCGFSDWRAREEKDVTGLECQDNVAPAHGDKFYSILREEPSRAGFRMGKGSEGFEGLTPETRHQEWSEYWYEKVK